MRSISTLATLLLRLAVVFWAPAAKAHCPHPTFRAFVLAAASILLISSWTGPARAGDNICDFDINDVFSSSWTILDDGTVEDLMMRARASVMSPPSSWIFDLTFEVDSFVRLECIDQVPREDCNPFRDSDVRGDSLGDLAFLRPINASLMWEFGFIGRLNNFEGTGSFTLGGPTTADGVVAFEFSGVCGTNRRAAPEKELTSGPLVPDGMGGFEPITDVDQGSFIAIGVREQYWIFAISITQGAEDDERVYVDALPSLYELAPDLELFDGCPDGICDGIGEDPLCPVTVTPPPSRGRFGQTLIAIEPDGLGADETCMTTVYVKLGEGAIRDIRSCPTADIYDNSELDYTFPFNDGVQVFDVDTNELLDGPIDPIRLTPVGCP